MQCPSPGEGRRASCCHRRPRQLPIRNPKTEGREGAAVLLGKHTFSRTKWACGLTSFLGIGQKKPPDPDRSLTASPPCAPEGTKCDKVPGSGQQSMRETNPSRPCFPPTLFLSMETETLNGGCIS